MRTRLIEALCAMLLGPLPLFIDFGDAARWVRYLATGNEAVVKLPAGESIVAFSPLSFVVIAVLYLAAWGLALLLTRWLRAKDRLPSLYGFMLFWGLLSVLWGVLQITDGMSTVLMSIPWMSLKFGLGTLLAALVAALLTAIARPRKTVGQL